MKFNYKSAGDSAVLLTLENGINEETNKRIIHLANVIEKSSKIGFGEVIIGYQSVLIEYNPLKLSYQQVVDKLKRMEKSTGAGRRTKRRIVEIPVLYGGEQGPDLDRVAQHNKLSVEEVIKIHSAARYLVYFLGFTPGYPFMGGMSEKIATPRLASPRISITPGSIGIAKNQTGIYPVASPGGWNLIGNTPLRLYDPEKANPFLLNAGDLVNFKSIEKEEFIYIKEQVENGTYKIVIYNHESA